MILTIFILCFFHITMLYSFTETTFQDTLYLSDPDKNNEKGGGFNQTAIVQSDVKILLYF